MRGLELRRLYLALDDRFASDWLLGVFLVIGEWANSLVIARLGRIRWFEGSIVLDGWSSLGLGCSVWNRDVFSNSILVRIEEMSLLNHLREWFLLKFAVVILTLCPSEFLWSVIVIRHVGDSSSEVYLLAVLTSLNWVSSDIRRLNNDISRVLLASEVLLDLNKVSLMFISSSVISLLDLALILEAFLISDLDLSITVFFAFQTLDRCFVLVANRVVARWHEQDLVDGCALLNGVSANVRWVDHDFFDLAIRIQSR